MPTKPTFSHEDRLIVITYSGKTTSTDLQLATRQANQYVTSYDCYSVLVDVREIEPAILSVDIYNMPKLYDSLGVPRNILIVFY
jgi:hypothetical protein